jgi:hypothetical protein
VRGLLEEPQTPPTSDRPTPSPESSPPTTTPSSRTTPPETWEAGLLAAVLTTMREMQSEQLREMREMVLSILQGRPMTDQEIAAVKAGAQAAEQPSKMPFDPPDYDSQDISDLPGGIQEVFHREDQEVTDLRHLQTEHDVLARQREQARVALGMDRQGPASTPSSLTDSTLQ